MKKLLKLCTIFSLMIGLVACSSYQNDGKTKVGIIQLAEHPALDASREGFIDALNEAGYTEENTVIDYKNANNDLSNCESIANLLVNDQSDLIYAIATPAAQSVANKTLDIPIVLSAITNPEQAGLVKSNEKPQINVTGTSDLTPISQQFWLMKQLLPSAKKIGIMYCSSEDNSIYQASIAHKVAKKSGYETVDATVSDSNMIQQVAESLVGKVDVIYVPTDNMLSEGMSIISQVSLEHKIPCIVAEKALVEKGGLATYGIDYYELGKVAGRQAISILEGKSQPEQMPIEYLPDDKCQLVINKTVAKKLGISIPNAVLKKAEVIK